MKITSFAKIMMMIALGLILLNHTANAKAFRELEIRSVTTDLKDSYRVEFLPTQPVPFDKLSAYTNLHMLSTCHEQGKVYELHLAQTHEQRVSREFKCVPATSEVIQEFKQSHASLCKSQYEMGSRFRDICKSLFKK